MRRWAAAAAHARVVYAREIQPRLADMPWPAALAPFDDSSTGCTHFSSRDGTSVRMLTAHLRRYCGYFRCEQADTSRFSATEWTSDELLAFRDLLYYDRLPDGASLGRVAVLADLLCDVRHTCMCVHRLARQDYWLAYDLASDWPAVRPWLVSAAHDQLDRLVVCSRIADIADMVAGVH